MSQVTRSEAIKNLLLNKTHPELAYSYTIGMECQVNVVQGAGDRIDGEFKGKRWHGFTDGITTWKSFRIPWNAATEPSYDDKIIKFDLAKHAEGIGMTGWDWQEKVSRWVAFDFDSIVSHKSGLTSQELEDTERQASEVDWVTVRKSTSGNGIHLYVYLDPPVPTVNHNEHAALARAILGQLAAQTGFDFINKVDICGGNMWVYHRKMEGTDGLKITKHGIPLDDVPKNWRDHVKVIKGTRRKNLPQEIEQQDVLDLDQMFEELTGQYVKEKLDADHKKLIEFLRENGCLWWWDQDNNMLVTHTFHLQEAFDALSLKGIFTTTATGKERGSDHNCFLYPLRKGSWVVRRFTPGVRESDSWDQDGGGWTRCYLNVEPDLATAARSLGGIEHPGGGYVFRQAEDAQKAALRLGADLALPNWANSRTAKMKKHKDGRLIVEFKRESSDNYDKLGGWLEEGRSWQKIFGVEVSSPVTSDNKSYDDVVRHLVSEQNKDAGWVIKSDGRWVEEPLTHVKLGLASLNVAAKDITSVLGDSIFKRWQLVNKPFQPEYPGDRQWNRDSCQFMFHISKGDDLHYPTWSKILNHVGDSLTPDLLKSDWAKINGVTTGADFLKCWVASMFQDPEAPLPYLYLWGPESSGKSMFHEAISLLMTPSGYQQANTALTSQNDFNGELRSAVLCFVEEIDLSKKSGVAYRRIKDWVTSRYLSMHIKNLTVFMSTNTTHWIQCSNDGISCPIFAGDTRIMVLYVDPIPKDEWEDKNDLVAKLKKEAPDFLGEIMRLEIPKSSDRMAVPVIATEEKRAIQKHNQTPLEAFLDDECFHVPGNIVTFNEFYSKFANSLDASEMGFWTKIKVGRAIPKPFVKGRAGAGEMHVGNISFEHNGDTDGEELICHDKTLTPKSYLR